MSETKKKFRFVNLNKKYLLSIKNYHLSGDAQCCTIFPENHKTIGVFLTNVKTKYFKTYDEKYFINL